MKTALLTVALAAALTGCANRAQIAADVRSTVAAENATTAEEKRAAEVLGATKKDVKLREAYALGQLQAAKSLYQAIQNTQSSDTAQADHSDKTLVPLTVPERKVDGVTVNASVEYVRLPN